VNVIVDGAEYMSRDHGVIYVANHVSWFDVFALASVLPRYSFVAKSELRRIPLFGWGAESAGIIFLERENRKAAFESYKVAAAEVRRGRSVVICPEGTRGTDYHLRPFKKGPFVLAIAAEAPIVPCLVYGAREVMPKGSFRIRPGTVEIHLLAPESSAGFDYEHRAELTSLVWNRMAASMRELYGVGTAELPVAGDLEQSA
jgi:1-acyl-sn-glycerol-3-phosphate acyltransferase